MTGRIQLDFRADDPIVNQIVRQIEDFVRQGVFKPGDQLPTVRELAIDLRINFSTVARAYRILDEKRLISTQRGRGTYIEEPTDSSADPAAGSTPGLKATEELERLARRFIREATQSGASPEQIERAFRSQWKAWQHQTPDSPGKPQGG